MRSFVLIPPHGDQQAADTMSEVMEAGFKIVFFPTPPREKMPEGRVAVYLALMVDKLPVALFIFRVAIHKDADDVGQAANKRPE